MNKLPCSVKVDNGLTLRAGTDLDVLMGVLRRKEAILSDMTPCELHKHEAMTRNLLAMVAEVFGVKPTEYPEKLPCKVTLPGVRLNEGVLTSTLLASLQRRAAYNATQEAMTDAEREDEQREDEQRAIAEVRAMLGTSQWKTVPVTPTTEMKQAIASLFAPGFIDDRMATDICQAVIDAAPEVSQ